MPRYQKLIPRTVYSTMLMIKKHVEEIKYLHLAGVCELINGTKWIECSAKQTLVSLSSSRMLETKVCSLVGYVSSKQGKTHY